MSPTFRSLAHRDYRRYATGGFVSNVGTWMQRVAQDWLVLLVTGGSASALGITTGLQFLPILLFSAFAGTLADRFPKRTLLMITQASMAVPAAVLGVLALTGHVQTWHIYTLAFAFGIATAFDAPVRQSFVSEMVGPDDLANAVSLNSVSFNAGRIVGPAVAGLMIAALGSGEWATGVVILLNAASYLAVLVALRGVRAGRRDPSLDRNRPRGRVRDGVTYLRFFPQVYNIDATDPSTRFTWVVKDANTGQVVPTAPYPYAPTSAVWVPVTSFVEVDGNLGKERHAIATLTLDQTSLEVSATGDERWSPPSPPPPSPCGPGHLVAKATSGGGTGAVIGC